MYTAATPTVSRPTTRPCSLTQSHSQTPRRLRPASHAAVARATSPAASTHPTSAARQPRQSGDGAVNGAAGGCERKSMPPTPQCDRAVGMHPTRWPRDTRRQHTATQVNDGREGAQGEHSQGHAGGATGTAESPQQHAHGAGGRHAEQSATAQALVASARHTGNRRRSPRRDRPLAGMAACTAALRAQRQSALPFPPPVGRVISRGNRRVAEESAGAGEGGRGDKQRTRKSHAASAAGPYAATR